MHFGLHVDETFWQTYLACSTKLDSCCRFCFKWASGREIWFLYQEISFCEGEEESLSDCWNSENIFSCISFIFYSYFEALAYNASFLFLSYFIDPRSDSISVSISLFFEVSWFIYSHFWYIAFWLLSWDSLIVLNYFYIFWECSFYFANIFFSSFFTISAFYFKSANFDSLSC